MTEAAQKLLEEARKLPPEDQVWLLDALAIQVNSSDDYDCAWQAEIARRTALYDAGASKARIWAEAEADLRACVHARQ
jgi:hypothetical protein